jgi:uncharacterized protein (TIGR01777 family)
LDDRRLKVVVSGGTGLVGTALVRALLADGHEVCVLTRNPDRAAAQLPVRCGRARWDPESGLAPTDALAGADAIVHLAGAGVADRRWSVERKRAILRSRVGGGEALRKAITALPQAKRPRVFVSASAVGFYGARGDEMLNEESARGSGFLADVCDQWESSVAGIDALGVRVVRLRLGVVLARGGGALARMLPPFRLGVGGRLGNGRQWMSWIHIDDLVRLIRFVIATDTLSGACNAVAPSAATNATFTRQLGRAVGRPTLIPVPALILRLAMGELASMLLTGQRVVPDAATRAGFSWRHAELGDALADLCSDHAKRIDSEQFIPAPIDEVFAFFSDAYNLAKITPAFMRFKVLGLDTEALREGTLLDYRMRVRGLPVRWRTRITRWDPPHFFADVQLRGPYRLWHHEHRFVSCDGGTLMRDSVRYVVPLGIVGEFAVGPLVARDLATIFAYRREAIAALFPTRAD